MTDMPQLLPCPFCGASDLVQDENGYKCKWIVCNGCGVTLDDSPHGDCADLWNARTPAQRPADPTAEDFEVLRELEVAWLTSTLCDSIANLGYPVGMGMAPNPEQIKKAATTLFERYAKMIAMARGCAFSSTGLCSPATEGGWK